MLKSKDADKFKKLGVSSLLDLALLIPKSYDNRMLAPTPQIEHKNTIHVQVISANFGPKVLSLRLWCETWDMQISGVIFAAKAYHRSIFRVGTSMYVSGKIQAQQSELSIIQPQVVTEINTIVAIYKTPLQNKIMSALMGEYLRDDALLREGLCEDEIKIVRDLHHPSVQYVRDFEQYGHSEQVINTLKTLEIYNYLKVLAKKKTTFEATCRLDSSEKEFVSALPFVLTKDQLKAIAQIKSDFNTSVATRRIIMGDVGCGKTMVMLASVMMAYPKRSVLMAPTTILAQQLFDEAKKFLPSDVRLALVTQSSSKKVDLNETDFVIGTHALLFRTLPHFDLVMIDEQHRFGTKQRDLINQLSVREKKHPHVLQFSATPIPRTMSMIQSSLVDFSFIKELPFAKHITTSIIHRADFTQLKEHISTELAQGRQVIIIYPLVEQSEAIEYSSIDEARAYWEKSYDGVFVTYGADKNKEEILERFRDEGSLLVATTLVEVGISLPRLSTMVIVGAERLGLASLHQLRGRVSRTGLKGYCFLYTNSKKSERLEEFAKTTSGFDIADLDLKFRKGGDILRGIAQSGESFVWFDVATDGDILELVKERLK